MNVEKNIEIINSLKMSNPYLGSLQINRNILYCKQKQVDLSTIDVEKLISSEEPLSNKLDTVTAEDFIAVMSIHSLYNTMKNDSLSNNNSGIMPTPLNLSTDKEEQIFNPNQEIMNQLQTRHPNLTGITISSNIDEYGSINEYINIVDKNGNDHLFYNKYNLNILEIYKEVLSTSSSEVTIDNFLEVVQRRCIPLHLDKTYNIANKKETSEEMNTEVENYERENKETTYALMNKEHNIIINSNHKVSTYDYKKDGTLVQQDHTEGENSDTEINSEKEQSSELKTQMDKIEIVELISLNEFQELLDSDHLLSYEEEDKVNHFNAYINELMIYEDYLDDELREFLQQFRDVIMNYEILENLNDKQQREVEIVHEMSSSVQKVQELKNENVKKLLLSKKTQVDNAGNVKNISIVDTVLLFVLIVMLTAIVLFIKK